MNCRKCKGMMEDATAKTASGTHGRVTATLFDFPYVVCSQCGSKAMVHAEFPAEVLFPLTEAIPYASARGLRTKQWSCSGCRGPIDPINERNETFSVPLDLKGRYPFRAELTMPAVRCVACGRIQVTANDRSTESDIADALIGAFDSSGPYNRW